MIGLVTGAQPSAAAQAFVATLAQHARIAAVAVVDLPDGISGVVLCDPDDSVLAFARALQLPLAVLRTHADPAEAPESAATIDFSGMTHDALAFPHPGVDTRVVLHVPPFLRARLRARDGLGATVVDLRGRDDLDDELRGALIDVASAVVVTGVDTIRVLATGCPTVTDAVTATLLGLPTGACVVIADTDDAIAAAKDLAADPPRAAELSLQARRFVEEHFDTSTAAIAVLDALDNDRALIDPLDPIATALAGLRTPADSVAVRRVARLLRLPH